MSRLMLAAIAMATVVCAIPEQADAQFNAGFRGQIRNNNFLRFNRGLGFGYAYFPNSYNSFHRPYNLPYFTQHPPVYYSTNIVRRPYGVSPYAVPGDRFPVEMQIQPSNPVKIVNPYAQDGEIPPPTDREQAPSNEAGEKKEGDWKVVPDKSDT